MKAHVVDILAAVFLLAFITLLVKPSSEAPTFIKALGSAVDGLVTFAVTG